MGSVNNNTILQSEDRAYNKRKPNNDYVPTLKKSLSRNTILFHPNNPSPTRPYLHGKPAMMDPQRQLTVETAVFPEHQSVFTEHPAITKRSSSTPLTGNHSSTIPGDARSVISGSESTRSNHKRSKKKANVTSSFVNPTDIFAQNLSDAVMDADNSDDQESYVYRDKPTAAINPTYTILPWTLNESALDPNMPSYYDRYYSSTESNTECNSGSLEYYHANKEKYFTPRRPVLRSTVSEIRPASSSSSSIVGNKKMRPSFKYKTSSGYYGNHPSDEEFAPLIRSRQPRRRKGISNHQGKRNNGFCRTCFTFLCIMFGGLLGICVGWLLLAISSSPLADVEVVGISNVLGTQKELMFNLQVRAKNSNWWTIRMTNTAFSVFASSQFVPTMSLDNAVSPEPNMTSFGADPAEFLGTIYHLEDPLIYQAGGLFRPVTSTATSQIQIKNPGATKDDNSGNERWSLLIRYPYELTVRGVLKYQTLPFMPWLMQLHSARVCKMSRIDPATGKISDDVSMPEKSICDDPSPVEGS